MRDVMAAPHSFPPGVQCDAHPAEAWLRRTIGLDPLTLGSDAVARSVRRRMEACGETDESRYAVRLAADAEEAARLIDDVVVPESWFFRDTQVFDFVRRFAIARAATPGRGVIRILSLPCAAGEEPYSIAICLLEAGLASDRFHIDGIDVSRTTLARAAAATYTANAFRASDIAFRDRWFHACGTHWTLDDSVRRHVHLGCGNLVDVASLEGRAAYDIVFCRNLLIYLAAEARVVAEAALERLVAADGLLVLGATEPPILKGRWTPAADAAAFTLRRGPPATQARSPVAAAGRAVSAVSAASPSASAGSAPAATAAELASAAPTATSAALRSLLAAMPAPPAAAASGEVLLETARRLADAGRRAEAIVLCDRHLRNVGPSAEAFFLLGMLHQAGDDLLQAEACLQKTLYLDASHEEAILALASLATRRGDETRAGRYRETAQRVRSRRRGP